MSAKHTPGPWEFSGDGIFGISPLNARVRLADICFHNRLNRIDSEANARLIAAAPELLDACKPAELRQAAILLASVGLHHAASALTKIASQQDTAIAKAEGRTP